MNNKSSDPGEARNVSIEKHAETFAVSDRRILVEELSSLREALQRADSDLQRIPEILAETEGSQAQANRSELEEEAQAIRDRRRDARLDLQEGLRRLVEVLQVQAVHNETVRFVLKQLEGLSPHPSVRVADQALALVQSLDGPGPPAAPHPRLAELQSIPQDRPTTEDRRRMAALIEEAREIHGDNLKSARGRMDIAEGTFNRLRAAKNVQPSKWRSAWEYVEQAFNGTAKK